KTSSHSADAYCFSRRVGSGVMASTELTPICEERMTLEMRPFLSLVIPAYNEGAPDRLPSSLEDIITFVDAQAFEVEVVIVNNNSTDDTMKISEDAAQAHEYIRVITEPMQGKGAAVKTGMLSARGQYLFI